MTHTHDDQPHKTMRLSTPFAAFAGYKPTNENVTVPKNKRRAEDHINLALQLRSLRRSKTRLSSQRDKLKAHISQLRHTCEHDSMTGVLNRYGLEKSYDRLTKAKRSTLADHGHILVFLDGDGFGQINKIYGDDVGDRVICAISESLKKYTRKTDIVARKGGDEFVVILRNVSVADMERLIRGPRGLQERLNRHTRVTLDDITLMITCSIGVTHFRGTESLTDVLRAADTDMRVHKQARKAIAQKHQ
jgi:diguanylate cyclase (GGDEF)-like protein